MCRLLGGGPTQLGRRPTSQPPGDRGIAHEGAHHQPLPAPGLPGGGEHGSRPRPPVVRGRDPRRGAQGELVAARRQRGGGLQARLRRRLGQEGRRQAPEGRGQEGRRGLHRDGRGPRGRVDRLASRGGPRAARTGETDGLLRDHPAGDPRGAAEHPPDRPRPRRRAGDEARAGPPRRVRAQPAAVAQDRASALGRARAERRGAPPRPARAGAARVRGRQLLGPDGPPGDRRSGVRRGAHARR